MGVTNVTRFMVRPCCRGNPARSNIPNSVRIWLRILAACDARGLPNFLPSQVSRGRRESRVRAAPAVSRARCAQEHAHEHTGSAESIRPSLRSGFTAYFVLSPVRRALLPPSSLRSLLLTNLAPASGARTTRLRRPRQLRSSCTTHTSTASHRNVRDDRDPPLSWVRRAELCP
jgi:hypothetical protein